MFEPRSIVASPLADDRPRLLVACDSRLSLDLLALFLGADRGFAIHTAQGADGACEAIARDGTFDLVLLDATLPPAGLAATMHRLVQANAGHPVALLCDSLSPPEAEALLAAGAAGLLARAMPARGLPHALRLVLAGERYVAPGLGRHPNAAHDPNDSLLSERQRQVLGALAIGRPNKTIARDLGMAEPTVKMHVTAICRKLGACNRTQAALIARERGLVGAA